VQRKRLLSIILDKTIKIQNHWASEEENSKFFQLMWKKDLLTFWRTCIQWLITQLKEKIIPRRETLRKQKRGRNLISVEIKNTLDWPIKSTWNYHLINYMFFTANATLQNNTDLQNVLRTENSDGSTQSSSTVLIRK